MKKFNSIALMIIGIGLWSVAYFLIYDLLVKCILMLVSIVLNIIAIVKYFKERRK